MAGPGGVDDAAHHYVDLSNVTAHYVSDGEGPAVVLLHGWPQTWYEWRHVIGLLRDRYRLIAPDLRGLGDTSLPSDGRYDIAAAADDVAELLSSLDLRGVPVVGHDWGGPIGYALAKRHPSLVERLALVDVVIPGVGAEDLGQGGKRWHHAFHRTPQLPELLCTGREREYLGWFFDSFSARASVNDRDLDEYVRTYSAPDKLSAGFEYYRATPHDERLCRAWAETPLEIPVLAIGGGAKGGRGASPGESARAAAADVQAEVAEGLGHFIPEEDPRFLARRLAEFIG